MKNIFIAFIVIALLLIAGKFYVEYEYSQGVDELAENISPYANLKHDRVHIGLDGSISIENISIIPRANIGSDILIDSITLASDDRWLPLKLSHHLEKGDLPDAISLNIENLDFEPLAWSKTSSNSKTCLRIETTFDNRSIGFQRLNSNLNIAMDATGEKVVLSMRSSDQTMRTSAKVTLNTKSLKPARLQAEPPSIDNMTFDVKLDEEVAQRVLDYCAKKLDLSKQVYLDLIVGSSNFTRWLNVDLGEQGKQALVDVLQGGKTLSLASKPNSLLKKIEDLKFYKVEEYTRLLGLKAQVDDQDIDLKLTELTSVEEVINTEAATLRLAEGDTQDALAIEQLRAISKARGPKQIENSEVKADYKKSSIRDAARYINSRIIVERRDSKKPLQGRLSKVDADSIYIRSRQYGGNVVFTVAKKEVKEIKIYR